jgi:acetyl-CoA synthetase
MITPFPASWCKLKPGCASIPHFGVKPVILDANGSEIEVGRFQGAECPGRDHFSHYFALPRQCVAFQGPGEGILAIKGAWPSMARTLHGDHERFEAT